MKLGLILKITSGGENEVFSVNKDDKWSKYAVDSRSIIKEFNGFDGTSKFIYILKFLGTAGYLIGIVQARPEGSGRPNDNTTAWIHVPSKVMLTGQELDIIIKTVKDEISARNGINEAKLDELLAHDHKEKLVMVPAVSMIKSDSEKEIGYRTFGKGSNYFLYELLGDSVAQVIYEQFKCICLLDNEDDISALNAKHIQNDIEPIVTTLPPSDNKGFIPYIQLNNSLCQFSEPIETPVGFIFTVKWMKEGYANVEKEYKVNKTFDHKVPNELKIQDSDRRIIIKKSWFRISNNEGRSIKDCSITINKKDFWEEETYVSEAAFLEGLKIEVGHPKYKTSSKVLSRLSNNIEIVLEDTQHSKSYILPKDEGIGLEEDAKIIVETKKSYNGMPLKGYISEGGQIYYKHDLKNKIIYFFSGVASVFVILIFYALFSLMVDFFDTHSFQFGWPIFKEDKITYYNNDIQNKESIDKEPEATRDMCVEYLDNSKFWNKDSMSIHNDLKGLYDCMNSFDFDGINKFEKRLQNSANFQELIKAVAANKNNKTLKVGKEKNSGNYNSDANKEINITEYIQWISSEHKITVQKKNDNKKNSASDNVSKITNQQKKKETASPKETKSSNGRGGYKNK